MKVKIITLILIVVINIMFFNINIVRASGISDVFSGGDAFIDASDDVDEDTDVDIDTTKLKDTSKMVYNILLIIGICIAVIVAAILGIKFMIGSVEEKAQIKDSLVPFVIGCVVVFGSFGFWKIFVTIGNDVSDNVKTELVADYVVDENGRRHKKDSLECKRCGEVATNDTINSGKCLHCFTKIEPCSHCGQKLCMNDFKNKVCSQCRTEIEDKDNPFNYYK